MRYNRNLDENGEINERTPLISIVRRRRHQHSVVRRLFIVTLGLALFWAVSSILSHDPVRLPIVDTQTCYSSLNNSRAYASAEALNNNINDFCQDTANNVPLNIFGWTRSKTYYPNTPEEYTMTVVLSNRAFSSNHHQCSDAMISIINGCDVSVDGSNPMNWKQGGKRVWGKYTYQIDISRQNRPWPPPAKPRQSCEGWYKFILQHYDIYGAGWANYDWGQRSLLPAVNPCCGLGSLTGWGFEYFDQPDDNGYEWHSWFNTVIGTRGRCFDNNRVQCAAGGPCDSYCSGNG